MNKYKYKKRRKKKGKNKGKQGDENCIEKYYLK